MFRFHLGKTLYLGIACAGLFAEPTVTLTPPKLDPGMEAIEVMLQASAESFTGEIAELVNDSLAKPLFMEGFGGAAAMVVLVPGGIHENASLSFSLGSAGSVFSENMSPKSIDAINEMTPESDMKSGACIQPLVLRIALPLPFLLPGLNIGGSIGFMDAESGDYGIWAFSAGLSTGYTFFKPRKRLIMWDGIALNIGADYAINRLTATIRPGVITEDIPIDPDGDGPLVPFPATLSLDPEIRAGVESSIHSYRIQATSGITFFEAFSLFGGMGFSFATAKAGISIETSEEIQVEGYLADLVETPGQISIHGTTAEVSSNSAGLYFLAGIKFSVGTFNLSVPVILKPSESLGVGAFLGIQF